MERSDVVPRLTSQELLPVREMFQSHIVQDVVSDVIAHLREFGPVELVSGEKVIAQ